MLPRIVILHTCASILSYLLLPMHCKGFALHLFQHAAHIAYKRIIPVYDTIYNIWCVSQRIEEGYAVCALLD